MINVHADLAGVYGFTGGSVGIIEAVESNAFQGDFTDHLMSVLKKRFTTDAIAVNASGAGGISHVFEWGDQDGSGVATGATSTIPLFRLTKKGQGGQKMLGFYFMPSVKPVPLPDPAKYGFKADKLQYLRRHIFKYKAIVMETQTAVTIAPRNAKALFIPLASADRGYIMTKNPVTINPGGTEASGGFSAYWTAWFEGVAPSHVAEQVELTEEMIAKTGQKILRDAAGRFSKGQKVGIAYVNAAKRTAQLEMTTAAKRYFAGDNEDWEE
jgi:hypothetical protein